MRIWIITVGEPLPTDEAGPRLLRSGILAERLGRSGHDVTWWTSAFDHVHKRHRTETSAWVAGGGDVRIRLLRSHGYRRNISLARWQDHRQLAQKFAAEARTQPRPDVILCSLPTLELCDEAARYGREAGCPVVFDVRDLWPDVFLDAAPRIARPLMNQAVRPLWHTARRACANATAIVGISEPFVDWGVTLAGRSRSPLDRVFPMGYRERQPASDEIAAAEAFWRERGVGVDSQTFVACFFGTINRHFEIPTLINAARRLAADNRRVQFVVCGDGDQRAAWQQQAVDCPQVVFPGWVNAAQIWSLMRLSSAGLAPYVSSSNFVRNLPNKPIEYLSAGLPIVSSLQGVLAELLSRQNCGITYKNGDAAGLAGAVAGLMDDPDRRQHMSACALGVYQREFVAERVYERMQNYLEELAAPAQRAAA